MRKNQLLLENLVYEVLNNNYKARNDDFVLITSVYETLCPDLLKIPFGNLLLDHKDYGLPTFESITRARRKVQAQFEELVSEKTKLKRKQLENEYREFYSNYEEWEGVKNYE